jgi:hypothetical protein
MDDVVNYRCAEDLFVHMLKIRLAHIHLIRQEFDSIPRRRRAEHFISQVQERIIVFTNRIAGLHMISNIAKLHEQATNGIIDDFTAEGSVLQILPMNIIHFSGNIEWVICFDYGIQREIQLIKKASAASISKWNQS